MTYRQVPAGSHANRLALHNHPVINMQQEAASHITIHEGGGPCGYDWQRAEH